MIRKARLRSQYATAAEVTLGSETPGAARRLNDVTVSSEPGIPSVQTCFGCHLMIGGSTPSHEAAIQKVRDAWGDNKPPQWVRIHTLPAFVHFPHMRHIKALGADACKTCHGDVSKMPQVHQVASLTMGWCVNCHVQKQVTRDCSVCHY